MQLSPTLYPDVQFVPAKPKLLKVFFPFSKQFKDLSSTLKLKGNAGTVPVGYKTEAELTGLKTNFTELLQTLGLLLLHIITFLSTTAMPQNHAVSFRSFCRTG